MTETNDMSDAVARPVNHATNSVHKAIDEASDAARPTVDHLVAGAHQAVDKLAGAANHTAETLDMRGGQVRDAQSWVSESCRGYVRDKPMAALGIAVATGFLVSWLLNRRQTARRTGYARQGEHPSLDAVSMASVPPAPPG